MTLAAAPVPQPFLDHVAKMLPALDDQLMLLSYMAAMVQQPSVILPVTLRLRGIEGGGKHACEQVLIAHLGKVYPSVYGWATAGKKNFFMVSDVPRCIHERQRSGRVYTMYTAQQTVQDLYAAGMYGQYLVGLYEWLHYGGGCAAVGRWLAEWRIPDAYHPANWSARQAAAVKTAEAERAEVAIADAVARELPGFRGGWISAIRAQALMVSHRISVTRRALYLTIRSMGYVPHPHLPKGRTHARCYPPDMMRTLLFVMPGSPGHSLQGHDQIAGAYSAAQVGTGG